MLQDSTLIASSVYIFFKLTKTPTTLKSRIQRLKLKCFKTAQVHTAKIINEKLKMKETDIIQISFQFE